MKIKVIKTQEEYLEAIALIEELVSIDPDANSAEGERLSLLAQLVQDYETETFPITLPDPVDAIKYRMEQQNMSQADLIPYIGSKSRVSEVLSRKRSLTLSMIRSLESGLGIPAEVLIRETTEFESEEDIPWNRFPISEMTKRGYFNIKSLAGADIKKLMQEFFAPIGSPTELVGMLRKSSYVRSSQHMDKFALAAWVGRVSKKATELGVQEDYKGDALNPEVMRKIAQISDKPNGPLAVVDFLKEIGIALVIEPHLPQTYLDGAAILINSKRPVVGLTLRYNRLDNFWFTLMHELAHISLHRESPVNLFYDDLDQSDPNHSELEKSADKFAREALIPQSRWENSPAKLIPSPFAAENLAKELGINVVIVAGRMSYEGNNYKYLSSITSKKTVRQFFPEVNFK